MYQQIDGVTMGSPLGHALANIFVKFHKQLLLENTSKSFLYFRYIDDTFAIFSNETKCNQFLQKLNSLYTSLVFTHKKKLTSHCHFLMCWLKSLIKSLLLQFIENPHSWDSIRAGIHLDLRREKLILLALLLTELLKFALRKSFQGK